ncbi:MAG: hypothetical protein ACLR6I_12405 [Waltera sp.]
MRKTARAIRAFNPIQSKYLPGFVNHPISNMIEDIMEKIHQNPILFKYILISFHFLYIYISKIEIRKKSYPNEWETVIDKLFCKTGYGDVKGSGKIKFESK